MSPFVVMVVAGLGLSYLALRAMAKEADKRTLDLRHFQVRVTVPVGLGMGRVTHRFVVAATSDLEAAQHAVRLYPDLVALYVASAEMN